MYDMSKYFIVSDKFNSIIRMNSVDLPTSICQKFTYVYIIIVWEMFLSQVLTNKETAFRYECHWTSTITLMAMFPTSEKLKAGTKKEGYQYVYVKFKIKLGYKTQFHFERSYKLESLSFIA